MNDPQPCRHVAPLAPASASHTADDAGAGLLEYVFVLWRYRLLIAAIVAVCTALGVAVALLTPPVYRATVVMMKVESEGAGGAAALGGQLGGLAGLAGISLGSGGSALTREALATLESGRFISAFIVEEDLLPVLFEDDWDEASQQWVDEESVPTMNKAIAKFRQRALSVSEDDDGTVELSVEWEDPALAARWGNQLAARINETMREEAKKDARLSLEYLNEELERIKVLEMRSVVFDLIKSHLQTLSLANTRPEFVFEIIDPAMPPDVDDEVAPNKKLLVVLAFGGGLFLAISLALMRDALLTHARLRTVSV